MKRSAFVHAEAALISTGGLILLLEISRSISWNIRWLERRLVLEPRFHFYVTTLVLLAAMFIVRGSVAARTRTTRAFAWVEAPVTLLVEAMAIVVVHGWRIRTDVSPSEPLQSSDHIPVIINLLVSWWFFYPFMTVLTAIVAVSFFSMRDREAASS